MGGMIPSAAMTAQQAKDEARAQTQQIAQTQAIATRQRQDQLRRALATQRARFGAQGVAAGSGSAEAALGGLEAEATREDTESRSLGELRIGRLNDQLDWQRRRNLLEASSSGSRSAFSLVQRGLRSVSLLGDG